MLIEIEGFCEKGLQREENQDCIYAARREDGVIAVIADGMGGHTKGSIASSLVCDKIRIWWENLPDFWLRKASEDPACGLEMAVVQANEEIRSIAGESICGTTVAALLLTDRNWILLSVGDTRCYKIQTVYPWSKVVQISPDDVWEQQKEIVQHFTKTEIENHPNYGKLIRAVGGDARLLCHIKRGNIRSGMAFFLCSDGVYRYCEKKSMEEIFNRMAKKKEMKREIERLKREVYNNQAPDNLSLIAIRVRKGEM